MLALGIGTAVLGFSTRAALAALSTFLMGVAIALVLVPAQTMSQQETPPQMVGRVSSTFMSMIFIAQILGLMLSGVLAEKMGMRSLFLASAVAVWVIAGIGWAWMLSRGLHNA